MRARGEKKPNKMVGEYVFTEKLLSEIDKSVRTVLALKFPRLPACEREDIQQEVRTIIWKMLASGKIINRLESYLWKVVFTTALQVIGGRSKQVSLDTLMEEGQWRLPEDLVVLPGGDELERRDLVSRLVEKLPQKRRLVVKYHLAGMSLEETAAVLGWTLPKVRHLFYRSVAELQELAKAMEPAEGRPQARKTHEGKKREQLPVPEPGSAGEIAPD